MEIARLVSRDAGFDVEFEALLQWHVGNDPEVDRRVEDIITRIRAAGDAALLDYTRELDRHNPETMADLTLNATDLEDAYGRLAATNRAVLEQAATRIRQYHEKQLDQGFEFNDQYGNRLGQRVTPLASVGVYVPGGQAAYPSTVLMTIIPAQVAGVERIVMVSPTPNGLRNDWVMGAAHLAGVDEAYCVGGAQAIAALAYGTSHIAKVDKIVGPGGAYVAAAKRQVFGTVGIDIIAGPSEVLIVADGSTPVEWLAWDMFSQAEHDAAAQAITICPDADYLESLVQCMGRLVEGQPRRDLIKASLQARGALIQTRDLEEAITLANRIAPEHLELAVSDPDRWLSKVQHAGAIFLGGHTPEVMGDYLAGPSHVLPTYGTARFASPLGVYDFQKRSSIIGLSPAGARALAPSAASLARGEGLEAHAQAAEVRLNIPG